MTKAKTNPKARARSRAKAPAAEAQPAAKVAPKPAPLMVQPAETDLVGFRTPDTWGRRDRNPRPIAELTKTATLVRGISWTISYSSGPLVFAKGKPVQITDGEFERLQEAIDRVDYDNGTGARIIHFIRKFKFQSIDSGKLIELEPLPDVESGEYAVSVAEQSEKDRKFEGSEHTAR